MLKINYLDIKHFKFFSDTEKIELGEKNLLIFGENGSGKSTIYWALYTFLQSSTKSNSDIIKYFTQSTTSNINEKSLVNIYESDDNKSYIKLNLKNIEPDYIISKDIGSINTNVTSDTLIAKTNLASDFISYKYLFRFFNFLHRDDIDLFPLFSYEILQFLSKDTVNLNELWNEILSLLKSKPRKNDKILNEKLTLFNSLLTDIISDLNIPVDTYLKQFNYKDLKLKLSVINGIFNGKELIHPKITLEIIVKKSDTDEIKIHRAQSFFNEAKLSAIALSVRLAVTYNKLKDSELKILVLDDLLVSLDMSNRETVLNVITNDKYLKDYQIIILTHEKTFFEMAKRNLKTNWEYLEMYENSSETFPKPLIIHSDSNFERAVKYFELCDYPVSGNYLRKASENVLKDKLLKTYFRENEKPTLVPMIQMYEKMCTDFNIDIPDCILSLKENAKRIFNPSSHDDLVSPLYKKEIEDSIKAVKEIGDLEKIEIKKVIDSGTILQYQYENNYKARYNFLGDINLYLFNSEIKNRDKILVGNCGFAIYEHENWVEQYFDRKAVYSLKEIFIQTQKYIKQKYQIEIDLDEFASNLKAGGNLLSEGIIKLIKKQCSENSGIKK